MYVIEMNMVLLKTFEKTKKLVGSVARSDLLYLESTLCCIHEIDPRQVHRRLDCPNSPCPQILQVNTVFYPAASDLLVKPTFAETCSEKHHFNLEIDLHNEKCVGIVECAAKYKKGVGSLAHMIIVP